MPTPTPQVVTFSGDFYNPPASGKVYADSEEKWLKKVVVYSVNKDPITGDEVERVYAYLDEAATKPLWADMAVELFSKGLLIVYSTYEQAVQSEIVEDVPVMSSPLSCTPYIAEASTEPVGIQFVMSPKYLEDGSWLLFSLNRTVAFETDSGIPTEAETDS